LKFGSENQLNVYNYLLIGESGGLILTPRISPYPFCLPVVAYTYKSHIIKSDSLLRTLCTFSILV